jgi:apolipoprotein N-acyltransferase
MTWLAETIMLSHGWRRALLLVLAGAIAGLSVPPFFILPALVIAMPVWIWALDGAEPGRGIFGRLFGPAFRIGFAFGWGYFLVGFHWLGAAFFIDGGAMLVLMPFAIASLAALIALFWGVAGALMHLVWSHGAARILVFASLLTGAEWLRGHVLSGFPFDLLGYALTGTREMMQAAALTGVYGLTFFAALLGGLGALVWPADQRPLTRRLFPVFLGLGLIAAQLGYGLNRLAEPVPAPLPTTARLIQPMVMEHADWGAVDPAAILTRLNELSEAASANGAAGLDGVDLLVWPESALPFYIETYPDALARIARMLPDETLLLAGAPRRPFGDTTNAPPFNALVAIDTEGQIIGAYDKAHLVPFGEFLPLGEVWSRFGIRQFVPGADGWQHGDARRRLMELPGLPALLALICYEILFSGDLGETEAAAVLLNVTNDAWFDASIGPAQHAHHARLRAVEEGIGLVRVANSGLTYATDAYGRITAELPARTAASLDVALPGRLDGTLFTQWRHWPVLALIVGGLLVGGFARLGRRTKKAP